MSDLAQVADTLNPADLALADKEKQTNRLRFLADVEEGVSVRTAAKLRGIPERTAYDILAKAEVDTDTTREAIRKLMASKGLQAVEHWQKAMEVGAEKKGNHAPARDWLLHAGVIDPVQADQNINVRVAICIGTPEQPMQLQSPQAIEAEKVSE